MFATLIGSLIGLFTRALPEVISYFDKKNDRKHELEMVQEQTKYSLALGAQKQKEIKIQGEVTYDEKALDAFKVALEGQNKYTSNSKIDILNSIIRPLITIQWVVILYPAVIIAKFWALMAQSTPILIAIPLVWTDTENGIVAGIINFFFLNRVLKIK